jgi:hypothetical protein
MCLLRTWLMKYGDNHSNRSCGLPVLSCLVLSDLVCPHYHLQWRKIGTKIMYPTHLHNIYSEPNYWIVPKFYTRWQQRSRKTTIVKSYINVAFRLPCNSFKSYKRPKDFTFFSTHTVSCVGPIFHKYFFIVTWIIQRNYLSIYVGCTYTLAFRDMSSFSIQKFPSGRIL